MIRAVLLFPILVLSLYGLGEWLRWKILGDAPLSPGRVGRALGFGILAHGLLMTLLGFVWLLRPPVAAVVTALPAIVFWQFWWRDIRLFFTRSTWRESHRLGVVEIVFLIIIIGITLIRLFNALAPNISWDATSHHYLVADVWLRNGRLSDLASVIFSYYPSLTEMGIAGAMALGTDFLSNLHGWLFGPLSILILFGICASHSGLILGSNERSAFRSAGTLAGIIAAFLFTLFPGVGVQTAGGYVDLPLACWILLTIDLLFEFRNNASWRNLIAAALFAGAALSTKHLALVIMPGFVGFLIWALFTKRGADPHRAGPTWGHLFAFIGIAILVVLPWYIRSVWLTGNPLYPFGFLGLPTPPQPPFTPSSWIRPDYHRSILGLLTYWLYLTFTPTVGQALGRNYTLVFPLLVPLVALVPRLKPDGRVFAVLTVLSILAVYWLFPIETRYHLPFIATVALLYGLLIAQWMISPPERLTGIVMLIGQAVAFYYLTLAGIFTDRATIWTIDLASIALIILLLTRTQRDRNIVLASLLLVLGIGSTVSDIQKEDLNELGSRYKVVLNLEYEDQYMLKESPRNYGVIHKINTEMDWGHMRILCLEPRLYRLKADWVTWFGLKEPIVPTTPAENVAIWYRGGFTHILLGDDVALKALMYYNIVHKDGWDIPGASPEELAQYVREHPDQNKVYFIQQDLWNNIVGERMKTRKSYHFRGPWLEREIAKERYPTEWVSGVRYHTANRLDILTDPERLAQYAFVRDFQEMVRTGGLKVAYTDELTFLFECDYPAYLESYPDVDLATLGLR